MRKRITCIGVLLGITVYINSLWAQGNFQTLDKVSFNDNAVTVVLSGESKCHAMKISNPPRVVMEFNNVEFNAREKEIPVNSDLVKRIRGAQFQNEPQKIARIVVDLNKAAEYQLNVNGKEIVLRLSPAAAGSSVAKAPRIPVKAEPVVAAKPLGASVAAPAATVAALPKSSDDSKTVKTPATPVKPAIVPEKKATVPVSENKPSNSIKKSELAPAKEVKTTVAAAPKKEVSPAKDPAVEKASAYTPAPAPAPKTAVKQPVETVKKAAPVKKEEPKLEPRKEEPVEVVAQPEQLSLAVNKTEQVEESKVPAKSIQKKQQKNETASAENQPLTKTVLPKKPITIDFEEADVRDVFRVLAMKSGINIIYGSDVSGTITLRLENVPFDKAFETILSLKNLVSQEQGANILRITTPQKIAEERVQAVTFTKVVPLNYAKAEEVKSNLDSIRTAEGRKGNISVDLRTNSLIITDTPEGLSTLERIVAELDRKPAQVIIEAKLVEIELSKKMDLGIQWQAARTIPTADGEMDIGLTSEAQSGGVNYWGNVKPRTVTALEGGTGVMFPAVAEGGNIGQIAFGIFTNQQSVSGVLSALEQKNLSKILSSPKVTTINNKEAKILVGQKIPYTTTTMSNNGITSQTNFMDVGIKLTVTPTINIDQKITLQVHPEVSLFVRTDPAGPVIGTREAETTVLVNDGETVVIGGLITENDKKLGAQVPLLGDLPVIGHLFKRDYNDKERTELLVFLTPQIINK